MLQEKNRKWGGKPGKADRLKKKGESEREGVG